MLKNVVATEANGAAGSGCMGSEPGKNAEEVVAVAILSSEQ